MLSNRLVTGTVTSLCALALTAVGVSGSADDGTTAATYTADCTYTIGFWKTHPQYWSTTALVLGSRTYSAQEALRILDTPVKGNGAVALAHQLIGAKLNSTLGADATAAVQAIADADALLSINPAAVPPIGTQYLKPATAAALTFALTDFNEGAVGPGHCTGLPTVTDPDDDGDGDEGTDAGGGDGGGSTGGGDGGGVIDS